MKTNNEKWHGSQKPAAGRDGKPFEKRDVKSILKGSRGAAKFGNDKPGREDNRSKQGDDFKRNDSNKAATSEKRSFQLKNDKPAFGERKSFESRDGKPSFSPKKPWENRDTKPAYGERKPWENRDSKPAYGERKPWENRENKPAYGDRKPYESREGGRPSFGGPKKPWENRDSKPKPWEDRTDSNGEKVYGRSYNNSNDDEHRTGKLSFKKPGEGQKSEFIETRYDNRKDGVTFRKRDEKYDPNSKYSQKKQLEFKKQEVDLTKPVRLNKFLANAGICSRREADEYIQAGVISVNGEIVTEMGVKVLLTDKIMFHDQPVRSERKVYLLLNKPKDCVTTSEDTHDRLTVLDLVKNACSERIYPVGRLDRNTTGVLLLTNDGDLASKLTHPKYDKKKIYHVTLDKPLEKADFETIIAGVTLDEETIAADALEFVKEGDLKQVGIEIHSGQNRVVRRIFEKLGYKIIRLDRVYFAGLTKKQLPRGKYRFLNEREINMLKMGAHQ
ncbi:MAG: pseudouridine synthase [Paludibacter sp.]